MALGFLHQSWRCSRYFPGGSPLETHCGYSGCPPPSFLGFRLRRDTSRPFPQMADRAKKMSGDAAQPMLDLQHRWVVALVEADTRALDTILVDSYVDTDEGG